MTAPEPTRPADEHTDAVARHLPYLVPWERLTEGSRNDYRRKARQIMDDPAVHAAMLAALVRTGVLVRTTITANNATVSMYATRWEMAP